MRGGAEDTCQPGPTTPLHHLFDHKQRPCPCRETSTQHAAWDHVISGPSELPRAHACVLLSKSGTHRGAGWVRPQPEIIALGCQICGLGGCRVGGEFEQEPGEGGVHARTCPAPPVLLAMRPMKERAPREGICASLPRVRVCISSLALSRAQFAPPMKQYASRPPMMPAHAAAACQENPPSEPGAPREPRCQQGPHMTVAAADASGLQPCTANMGGGGQPEGLRFDRRCSPPSRAAVAALLPSLCDCLRSGSHVTIVLLTTDAHRVLRGTGSYARAQHAFT